MVLNVRSSTPSLMVYGELGRHPIRVEVASRMISFWGNLISGEGSKISSILYKLMYKLNQNGDISFPWIDKIQQILDDCGYSEVWLSQSVGCLKPFKANIKKTLLVN